MSSVKQTLLAHKFFVVVLLAYIGLTIFMPGKALLSFKNSLYYVKEMLTIMPVILILTSLITAWVPRKTIENAFGKDSGLKGAIFSFLLGSFSAGPIYAAFPVCKALLGKGASVSNIIIILSTWAVIKVPMLLNEAKFLSPRFMIIRWGLTTLSIFAMGLIASKLVKKEDIPAVDMSMVSDEVMLSKEVLLSINQQYCIGCGICAKSVPTHFEMMNKKAHVIIDKVSGSQTLVLLEVVEKCPSKAIAYK